MKNLKPIGIPHSIFFENLFAKTYDSHQARRGQGHASASSTRSTATSRRGSLDQKVDMRDTRRQGHGDSRCSSRTSPGKRADITLPVEEGRLYHLNNINFVGVKLFRTPGDADAPAVPDGQGRHLLHRQAAQGHREHAQALRRVRLHRFRAGARASSITQTPTQIDLTLNVDEGKQFFVRRIDFSGNTTTRDKVIRRELLLDEGDMFNTALWELSILRLNQLGYFEVLKEEEAADIKRNPQTNTVDITLKVKERGKNSIGLNGGVSGIAGSFIGFNYSTNNFLGLGETLSLERQLGTRIRNVSFGFTEPYFLDRPMQVGFVVYLTRVQLRPGPRSFDPVRART